MNRRSWMQSLAALFVAPEPEPPTVVPCVTPAYAGFDGSFHMGRARYKIILAHASVSSANRYTGLVPGMMGVWKNEDGSVSRMLYRNREGKLFDLQFVPMKEPT